MSSGNQLDSSLGNGSARQRLCLSANLINHDDLRHVVLHSLHLMQAIAIADAVADMSQIVCD